MADVLVIEDHPVNLELLRLLLQAYGHGVRTAPDAESGLALARAQPPDLLICDIQLPGMDGYAMAGVCRADPALSTLPLVAVTALAMVGDREKALAAGFDLHISKPIDPSQFMVLLAPFLPTGAPTMGDGGSGTADAAPQGIPPGLRAPRAGLRVLLVDDERRNQAFKRQLLEPAGYRVDAAADGEAAWRALASAPVDLVLCDVVMPGLDGFALLQRVRAHAELRDVPFVFLTASARDAGSKARGLALGAQAYLLRPIAPLDLLAALRDVLAPPGPG